MSDKAYNIIKSSTTYITMHDPNSCCNIRFNGEFKQVHNFTSKHRPGT